MCIETSKLKKKKKKKTRSKLSIMHCTSLCMPTNLHMPKVTLTNFLYRSMSFFFSLQINWKRFVMRKACCCRKNKMKKNYMLCFFFFLFFIIGDGHYATTLSKSKWFAIDDNKYLIEIFSWSASPRNMKINKMKFTEKKIIKQNRMNLLK